MAEPTNLNHIVLVWTVEWISSTRVKPVLQHGEREAVIAILPGTVVTSDNVINLVEDG